MINRRGPDAPIPASGGVFRSVRKLYLLAAVIATTVAIVPGAAASQVTQTADAAAAMSCDRAAKGKYLTLTCYRTGLKRGWGRWNGTPSTESIYVQDQRADDRAMSMYVQWTQNGSVRRARVTDSMTDRGGDSRGVQVPDGRRVYVYMCLEGIGCSNKYGSYA